jgi:hypothetical protein
MGQDQLNKVDSSCEIILKDSSLNWCEKLEWIEDADNVNNTCLEYLIQEMSKKTKIPFSAKLTEFGLDYISKEQLDADIKKWKNALNCVKD